MAKLKYGKAKQMIEELYYIIPLINSRMALRYLEKLNLPKDQIPKSHGTINKWFKEFGEISDITRRENLIEYLDSMNTLVNNLVKNLEQSRL